MTTPTQPDAVLPSSVRETSDTPQPIAEPVVHTWFWLDSYGYPMWSRGAHPGNAAALYLHPSTDLRTELDAMTAERDEMKSNYAFLEISLRYMQDDRDKWLTAYRDTLAELRKVSEELGALKGERAGMEKDAARFLCAFDNTHSLYGRAAANRWLKKLDAAITAQGEKP